MYLIKFQKSLEVIMLTKQFLKFKYRCQSEGKSLTVEFKWKTVMVMSAVYFGGIIFRTYC